MTKEYIKANAERIAKYVQLYHKIRSRDGYKLGYYLKGINGEFSQGVTIATLRPENFERGALIWRGEHGEQKSAYGDDEMIELLTAVFSDEKFFETIKESAVDYDGRITWTIDECIRNYDFKTYQDARFVEHIITLNPANMRVTAKRPREYNMSVLVALNID